VYLNPRRGGQIAVAEAARNVVCTGAKPLAITNCLNFGNPYDPEVYWQFKEAVAGIGEACRVLETPVTGGNVSFYNESPEHAVYPTPVIGMLGLIESFVRPMTPGFREAGDVIVLLGVNRGELGGSVYLSERRGSVGGDAPMLDLAYEKALHGVCLEMIRKGLIESAHDVSEGGIGVSLAESCFAGPEGVGASVDSSAYGSIRADRWLFGEGQSMIVVTAGSRNLHAIKAECRSAGVAYSEIGVVNSTGILEIGKEIKVQVSEIREAWKMSIENSLGEGI